MGKFIRHNVAQWGASIVRPMETKFPGAEKVGSLPEPVICQEQTPGPEEAEVLFYG